MNLQQLRYASALAELGSFVDAAKQCGVTQGLRFRMAWPSWNRSLDYVFLFARTRKVELSEFGRHLLPSIGRSAERPNCAGGKGAGIGASRATDPSGSGVSPLVGIELVSLIVEPFRRTNANVEIIFREMNLEEMTRLFGDWPVRVRDRPSIMLCDDAQNGTASVP